MKRRAALQLGLESLGVAALNRIGLKLGLAGFSSTFISALPAM